MGLVFHLIIFYVCMIRPDLHETVCSCFSAVPHLFAGIVLDGLLWLLRLSRRQCTHRIYCKRMGIRIRFALPPLCKFLRPCQRTSNGYLPCREQLLPCGVWCVVRGGALFDMWLGAPKVTCVHRSLLSQLSTTVCQQPTLRAAFEYAHLNNTRACILILHRKNMKSRRSRL